VFEERGAAIAGWEIAQRAGRRIYAEKDPRGYAEFLERLQGHSAQGAAAAIRGVLIGRKTIFEMEEELRGIGVPTLVMVGDRDGGAVDASLFIQRTMRHASVVMFPFTGHTPNLEEPLLFNRHVGEFLAAVSEGRWATWRQSV
jgi:pimeloyl-ACP methyl ester carboxylesterase